MFFVAERFCFGRFWICFGIFLVFPQLQCPHCAFGREKKSAQNTFQNQLDLIYRTSLVIAILLHTYISTLQPLPHFCRGVEGRHRFGCKVMYKRIYGEIIGRALLQCDSCKITILRANLQRRCANLQTARLVEIQTLLLLDAFYEFSRCDTCNFLEIPDRCSTLIVSYISKQLR